MSTLFKKENPGAAKFQVREVGRVSAIKQFIAVVTGLPSCINGQIVEFEKGMNVPSQPLVTKTSTS